MTAAETQRAWWAIQLARDVETCCSLIRNEAVDVEGLDPLALEGAKQRGAVTLCQVSDLFEIGDAA